MFYANQVLQTIEGQDISEVFSFDATRLGTYRITYTVVYDQTIYSYDYTVECVAGEATFEFDANDKNIIPAIYDTEMAKQHNNKDIVLPLPTVNDEDGNAILTSADSADKKYYTLTKDGSGIATNEKNCYVYISVTNGADDIAITTNENGDYIIDGDSLIDHKLDGRTFTHTHITNFVQMAIEHLLLQQTEISGLKRVITILTAVKKLAVMIFK